MTILLQAKASASDCMLCGSRFTVMEVKSHCRWDAGSLYVHHAQGWPVDEGHAVSKFYYLFLVPASFFTGGGTWLGEKGRDYISHPARAVRRGGWGLADHQYHRHPHTCSYCHHQYHHLHHDCCAASKEAVHISYGNSRFAWLRPFTIRPQCLGRLQP